MDRLVFDYNPFEDIQQNRDTIWQMDVFETELPPLIATEESGGQTGGQTTDQNKGWTQRVDSLTRERQTDQLMASYMRTLSQSVDCLDANQVLEPIEVTEEPIHDTFNDVFASGDCQQLWRMADNSQTLATNKTLTTKLNLKKKERRLRINSLDLKPNSMIHFPEKLWRIINECKCGAIKWSVDGLSVCINYYLFQKHYLNDSIHFKTKNISSFVRQLNLYGFHKLGLKSKKKSIGYPLPSISGHSFIINGRNPTLGPGLGETFDPNEWHEFQCEFFQRDHKELLDQIKRKYPNQGNDENCGQTTKKPSKTIKSALKILNEKTRKESKPKTIRSRKQFEPNLNSVHFNQIAVNTKQSTNCFNYYSFNMIFGQNFSKTSDNLIEMNDRSVGTVAHIKQSFA